MTSFYNFYATELRFLVGFSETTYCNMTNNYPPCSFTKLLYLSNFVEERFSILSRRDHSTSRAIDALYIIVFKSCLLNYAGLIY